MGLLIQYVGAFAVSALISVLGAVMCIINPVTWFFLIPASFALWLVNRISWDKLGVCIKLSVLWPLTLAPLHALSFHALGWETKGFVLLFIGSGFSSAFLLLLAKSAPIEPKHHLTCTLAAKFRKFRKAMRGNSVEYWNKLKRKNLVQSVVIQLGWRICESRCSEWSVRFQLGPPDETVEERQQHGSVLVSPGERHLLYKWEDANCYVYFIVRDGSVAEFKWLPDRGYWV